MAFNIIPYNKWTTCNIHELSCQQIPNVKKQILSTLTSVLINYMIISNIDLVSNSTVKLLQ